ncbi:HD domain-containing protein [Campylobacter sp. MIT 97-5078]|uniref:HD domain-containing protein n=1 Tax=Campylobacter sp. MIT 97-5078 TaxID=1548153 RepID=UPI00051473C6|nr:HD domain-containing protein [Campylobacter sp. MIT 97-5078]KGI55426.1 hypothetical protein LR59_12100 [Campylobacter sp. MIT 97-5078]TQR27421.1 HD domain-containing protein [Campylobacter sp. MIT 97-5078]
MLDLIESTMNYIYKHSLIRSVSFYIFVSLIIFFSFIFVLLIFNTEIFSLSAFFDINTYWFLMQKYKDIIAIFLMVEQVGLISIILWQDRKLQIGKKANTQVHIEEIAHLWTKYNTQKYKNNSEKTIYNKDQNIANINESLLSVAHFNEMPSLLFINETLKPYVKKISSGHLKTIIKLINLLEQNKDCPSVVAYAKTEPNMLYKDREYVSFDKKTRFDIYEQISVYKHSLSVARLILELIKQANVSKKDFIGKAIIVALAHDIGKIKKYEMKGFGENGKRVNFKEFSEQPHQNLSSIILYDSFTDCPDLKEIAEVVQRHHSGALSKDEVLLKFLIDADKGTRDIELDLYRKGEEICDLKAKTISTNTISKPKENKIIPKQEPIQREMIEPKNLVKLENIFNESIYTSSKPNLALLKLDLGNKLDNKEFESLNSILEKELQIDELNFCTHAQGLYLVFMQKDRSKAFNLAYDISQRLNLSEFKTYHIGLIMSRDSLNYEDCLEKVELALNKAKQKKSIIVDFRDIKGDLKDSEKISLSDVKQEETTIELNEKQKEKILDMDFEDVFESFENKVKEVKPNNPIKEQAFDIESIERIFLETLRTKINTMEKRSFKIASISYKKFVLFTKTCLMQTLKEILKNDENLEQKIHYLIRYYRYHEDENKRLVWFVGVDNGYYESMYYIKNPNEELKTFACVPFEAKMTFNLSIKELESMKKSSEVSSYSILEYNIKKDTNEK